MLGAWIIRKSKRMLGRIFERKGTDTAISSFVQSIAGLAMTVVLIMITVGVLGIDTTSIAALLAGGGMAIGLALNGTVQNFAGGIMLLIFKPFKSGDFIEAQGYSGTVSEVTITSTKLVTTDNRVIIIPNGILSNGTINNYSDQKFRRVDLTVDVEYGSSSEQVKDILNRLIENDVRILQTPAKPFIALSALKESSVQFIMRLWVKTDDYWGVYYELTEKIYNELPKNGIMFPFPQLDINIKASN
jgi:small conductance mechanosensitive channel